MFRELGKQDVQPGRMLPRSCPDRWHSAELSPLQVISRICVHGDRVGMVWMYGYAGMDVWLRCLHLFAAPATEGRVSCSICAMCVIRLSATPLTCMAD